MARKVLTELAQRFGFPDNVFRDLALVDHEEDVFITTPEAEEFDRIKPVRKGIRLARVFAHGIKPTTNAMQLLGGHATKNAIEVNEEQAAAFVQGEAALLTADAEEGFVIVKHGGFVLGVGVYRRGLLKSQVPLSRRTR
jgi:NOL1/NOP2/fmu family ribosome biogenesis protein